MKAFGIIAEYNPFHEGHKYLIDTASALLKADVCVSVMSGNFVQRGGYAYFDKWNRSEAAVKSGVDLVVEMPQLYACSSAGNFAFGGVKVLNALNCDYIAFGSESGDINTLTKVAKALINVEESTHQDISTPEGELYLNTLREELDKGNSYPKARSKALSKLFPKLNMDSIEGANDILALEYLKAIEKEKNANRSSEVMEAIAIKRTGDKHSVTSSRNRRELELDEIEGPRLKKMSKTYFDLVRYAVLSKTEEELDSFDTGREGLGNKLKKEIRYVGNLNELIERVKSKRYTYTRISRLLTHILLDIHPENYYGNSTYIRPLAMNEKGAAYLKEIKKDYKDRIIVEDVSKYLKYGTDEKTIKSLNIDVRASDIYSVLCNRSLYSHSDFVKHPKCSVLR